MAKLAGKVVWLTGASSGIGEALALALGAEKTRLAITARRAGVVEELARRIEAAGGRCIAVPGDVTDEPRMKAAAAEIAASLGPVDLLVANAGTYKPTDPLAWDTEEYAEQMRVNYFGMLNCIGAVLPAMLARRSGHISAVSSVVGYRGLPRGAAYGATKAAMINFLEAMRFHTAPQGVAVTIINPGFVKTPLTDKNEFPMPFIIPAEDAAQRIVRGLERAKKEIHFPGAFSWPLKLMRVLPYPIYERLVAWKTL